MQQSKAFVKHATYMIEMLDRALNMLGPDAELLGEILSDCKCQVSLIWMSVRAISLEVLRSHHVFHGPYCLSNFLVGKKHARLGVQEQYFPFMGEALLEMLHEILGNSFTPDIENAWKNVYAALSESMVASMNTEKTVLYSWSALKKHDNYEEKAGGILFQQLFRRCPETKTLFGFPLDMDTDSSSILQSRRFKIHSMYFIEMLDKALGMAEAKQMEGNLKQLGALHSEYGVKNEYFPIMGEALFYTLEELLKDEWNEDLKAAWKGLYGRLSSQMISAMKEFK